MKRNLKISVLLLIFITIFIYFNKKVSYNKDVILQVSYSGDENLVSLKIKNDSKKNIFIFDPTSYGFIIPYVCVMVRDSSGKLVTSNSFWDNGCVSINDDVSVLIIPPVKKGMIDLSPGKYIDMSIPMQRIVGSSSVYWKAQPQILINFSIKIKATVYTDSRLDKHVDAETDWLPIKYGTIFMTK